MHVAVVGTGAVGSTVAARLLGATDGPPIRVTAFGRGAHASAVNNDGLTVVTPHETTIVPLGIQTHWDAASFADVALVILAVKSQDTDGALAQLRGVTDPETPILCAQNGIGNEATVASAFSNVYGVCVMMPVMLTVPGVVRVRATPIPGALDVGRYPTGVDDVASMTSALFRSAGFASQTSPRIMAWKWAKLLDNLANAVDAFMRQGPEAIRLVGLARSEAERVLEAAGVDFVTRAEIEARRATLFRVAPDVGDHGSSTWQSVVRGARSVEVDSINGEVVRLGAELGVPTPVNSALCELAHRSTDVGVAPRTVDPSVLLDRLDR